MLQCMLLLNLLGPHVGVQVSYWSFLLACNTKTRVRMVLVADEMVA